MRTIKITQMVKLVKSVKQSQGNNLLMVIQ